jgi:N-acetylglucosamine transport system permease protein
MNQKTRVKISEWIMRILIIFFALLFLYPLIWNIMSSFKTNEEFLRSQIAFPRGLAFDNYVRAFQKANVGGYFFNSVFVVALSTCFLLLFIVPTSYTLARFRFPFSRLIENIYMTCLFVGAPLVPLYLLLYRMHMTNSLFWMSFYYAVSSFPFTIFLLSGYMRSIPKSYADAAHIDGCGNWNILLRIIVPLAGSGIATVTMLSAMGYWNEYTLALVLLRNEAIKTLPVGIAHLYAVQRRATDFGALFAALVIVLIPTIAIYLTGQKALLKGIGVGGIKE